MKTNRKLERVRRGMLSAAVAFACMGLSGNAYALWKCNNHYCTEGGVKKCSALKPPDCGTGVCKSPEIYTCLWCQCKQNIFATRCNCQH